MQRSSRNSCMVKDQLERIQEECLIQENKSQQIKENLNAVIFYNSLIGKNVSTVFNKIL